MSAPSAIGDHLARGAWGQPRITDGRCADAADDLLRVGALYDRVLVAFPTAYLADPHDLPEIARRLGDHVVGRGQVGLLAALFHADAPNDVAPSAYNQEDASGELPSSPLTPRPAATGFRWTA